jgi:O-antigen/teichoic acid export membrane protein
MLDYYLKVTGYINDFFTRGHQRSINAKKNIFASFIIKGFSIAISLLIVPLSLNYVNPSQYGVWLTLSSMVAWISFFDIGFTQGFRNKFAEAKAKGDTLLARIYVSTTYYYMSIIFLIVWLFLLIISQIIDWQALINITEDMETEVSRLVIIIVTYFCFQFVFKIINTLLIADEKPAKASFIDLASQFVSLLVIFAFTRLTSGSLLNLGIAIGVAPTIVIMLATYILFRTQYRDYLPSIKFVKKEYAKDIMNLGLKFFVLQIAVIVQYGTTSFLIAHYFNTEQVTSYNIAYKYFFTLQMIFMILLTPLWSAATVAYNSGDTDWIKGVVRKYLIFLVPFILFGVVMLVFAKPVYDLWLGKDTVEIKFSISLLCYIFFATAMFASIFVNVINGIGALKIQFVTSIITSIGFLSISILLIQHFHFGVESILIAAIISNVYGFILAPLQYYHIFIRKSGSKIWYA